MNLYNFIIVLFYINYCYCWDSDQLEVFDVVEEVKVNFYDALNISKDDNSATIRSAFRRQSLLLHPDKNPNVDTSEQFRNLVSIYEILKDPNKRKYYDEVLVNGLPNWRSAVYYYRHVRRMGLLEMSIILFCIITIGQYIVSWAAYLEKKYTLEQVRGRKQKKIVASIELEKPSYKNTLPFQIPLCLYRLLINLPSIIYYFKEKALEKVEAIKETEEVQEEILTEHKSVRRRKVFVLPEGPTFDAAPIYSTTENQEQSSVPLSGGLWTDDDLEQLIALVKKYPGGTAGRWELIAEALRRSVAEVTYMANKMKSNGYKLPSQDDSDAIEQPKVKQKTKGGKLGSEQQPNNSTWTQSQQKALEDALLKYPKGSLERWERISECIHNKTKEECILRYKSLVEAIKHKKDNYPQVDS